MAKKKKKSNNIISISDRRGVETEEEVRESASAAVEGMTEEVIIPKAPVYAEINLAMQGDRMLIQPFPIATKIGSLFTPDNREMDIDKGRVCSIGKDVKNIKVGDIICKMSGLGQSLVDDKGNKYVFLPENAAIAVDTSFTGRVEQCNNTECKQYEGSTPNHCKNIANILACKDYINHNKPKDTK